MVKIQVRWAEVHPGQDRRLPGVITHSRPERAPAPLRVETTKKVKGAKLETTSCTVWVTQGRGKLELRPASSSVAVRGRGH